MTIVIILTYLIIDVVRLFSHHYGFVIIESIMLINHTNINTIEAILTIELLEVEDGWSKGNAEIVITSNGICPCWICLAINNERSTMLAKITHSEITAVPAKKPPNRYLFSKNCPAPGKTRNDNNAALSALFILTVKTYG